MLMADGTELPDDLAEYDKQHDPDVAASLSPPSQDHNQLALV